MCTFLFAILWPEVQSHSDDSPVHAPGPRSACALAQAHPTMSCIHLVKDIGETATAVGKELPRNEDPGTRRRDML